jgi:5-methylcytosine-specific restriction endonuclease McrA
MSMDKTCTGCGLSKPPDEFYSVKSGKYAGRLLAQCRACYHIRNQRALAKIPRKWKWHTHLATETEKACTRCERIKPRADFHVRKSGRLAGRIYEWCKECCREAVRVHKRLRPLAYKAWQANLWGRKQHDGTPRIGITWSLVTESDLVVLLRDQQGQCGYCGLVLSSNWQTDHRIPLSRGGAHTIDNLVAVCAPCNRRKWTQTDEEYLTTLQGELSG